MKISIEELKDLANRLLFDMKEEEYQTLQEEFEVILSQMDLLGEIEGADSVSPMTFPYLYESIGLREDEEEEGLTNEEVLLNAKDKIDGYIRINKVI